MYDKIISKHGIKGKCKDCIYYEVNLCTRGNFTLPDDADGCGKIKELKKGDYVKVNGEQGKFLHKIFFAPGFALVDTGNEILEVEYSEIERYQKTRSKGVKLGLDDKTWDEVALKSEEGKRSRYDQSKTKRSYRK